jgi:hypothetical protein
VKIEAVDGRRVFVKTTGLEALHERDIEDDHISFLSSFFFFFFFVCGSAVLLFGELISTIKGRRTN